MSDSRCIGMGVLKLRRMTPVIEALFGSLILDKTALGEGVVTFERAPNVSFRWAEVDKGLRSLATSLGLELNEGLEGTIQPVYVALEKHFKNLNGKYRESEESTMYSLTDVYRLNQEADLTELTYIADGLDDGHGLESIGWVGSKKLEDDRYSLGKNTFFDGPRVKFCWAPQNQLDFGSDLENYLKARPGFDECPIKREIERMFAAIVDNDLRRKVADHVAKNWSELRGVYVPR